MYTRRPYVPLSGERETRPAAEEEQLANVSKQCILYINIENPTADRRRMGKIKLKLAYLVQVRIVRIMRGAAAPRTKGLS